MPMTGIEPYRPPRPTIRELMEGRPAGVDDGGISPKGYQGTPRKIQPWRAEEQRRAHGAREQQYEDGQETGDAGSAGRREERGKRRERREVEAPTWLGRGPPRGTPCVGERNTDANNGAVT